MLAENDGLGQYAAESIIENYTQSELDKMIDYYISAYLGAKLSREEALEEILCDAYSGINIFEGTDIGKDLGGFGAAKYFNNVKDSALWYTSSSQQSNSENAQKNTTSKGGDKYSYYPDKIAVDITEDERANILKNTVIKLAEYKGDSDELNAPNVSELQKSYKSKAAKILKTLGEKFGVYKTYSNDNIDLTFDYSRSSLNESVDKQNKITTDFYDFAKMLFVFNEVIENAVPIEVHTDKYVGTKKENQNLKYDYV